MMRKTTSASLLGLVISICIFGSPGCGSGDAEPGAGPAFSTITPALTAKDLWQAVSRTFYIPALSLSNEQETCEGGGTVTVENLYPGKGQNYIYSHCKYRVQLFGSPAQTIELEATGMTTSEPLIDASHRQQRISFSGDLGFSANCDFTVGYNVSGSIVSYAGTCRYRDSSGVELTIDGEQML